MLEPQPSTPIERGLVLTGGGARGAYQAGVLLGVAELSGCRSLPYSIVAGSSAGSINGAFLASRADDFQSAARELCDLWIGLRASDVFRTDLPSLSSLGARWIVDLAFGGWVGSGHAKSLLDTSPLRALITKRLDVSAIRKAIARGRLRALAVTATNYRTGNAVTFFEATRDVVGWTRSSRLGIRVPITVDHVLASSAIPVFFPAVAIEGAFYADGCVRLATPFSPAIRLGASRVMAIGVRHRAHEPDPLDVHHEASPDLPPSHANVGSLLLDAVFLDALDSDFERLERVNRTLKLIPPELRKGHELREIPATMLLPSTDLGALAAKAERHLPAILRHLLEGLGVSERRGWDLLSYLAFDSAYTARLVELGYEDARKREAAVAAFFG